MSYLFNDTDIAAYRLKVLAGVFAPSTAAFVRTIVGDVRQVVDPGCGPGYTTHLLAETTSCERAVGLDASEHFIELARRSAMPRISFVQHDITTVPFPVELSDLIFCRFLLTHLKNPQAVLAQWATQLGPQGLLLVEETEWHKTDNALFRTYLDIITAMLQHQGNALYIGPSLDQMHDNGGLKRRMSRVQRLPVATASAATMFYLNVQSWKNQPFIQQRYGPEQIQRLEEDLRTLAETSTRQDEIVWGLRQMAFERA